MFDKFGKILQVMFCGLLVVQLTGCGTLLYPERRGQRAGHIDVGVALLDGIGLLLFVIPGVIAFAVDFSNGTIYVPGTAVSSLDMKNIKQVKFDPKLTGQAGIERIVKEQTGLSVKLDQSNMTMTKLKSTNDMIEQFAQLSNVQNDRIALNYLTGARQ
jgi:hypothetical protein